MALLTMIAPLSPVTVAGMALPNATVEWVELRSGPDPLLYHVTWRESPTGPIRRATFKGNQVTELEVAAMPAAPLGGNRMGDLGRMMAANIGEG